MATGLKFWFYRPDIEAQERKINKYFVYNAQKEKYYDVLDREKSIKNATNELQEKIRRRVWDSKMEVPYE